MMFEEFHPIIPLSDWQGFKSWPKSCKEFPLNLIDEVIDRDESRLPKWFVPLARGVAIASDALLRAAGHRDRMHRPRGWRETSPDNFVREIGWDSFLLVRESDETGLWTVERLGADRRYEVDEVLVFTFGWTPILTRSYQSAMRLAMHCHANGPPAGLRWIKTTPNEAAIEIARKRRIDEALGANGAQPEGRVALTRINSAVPVHSTLS